MSRRLLRAGLWSLVLLGVALVLVALVVMAVLARRPEARLDRALRQLAASGAPVEPAQLAKPPIPDAENAALVYQQAFKVMQFPEQEKDLIRKVSSDKSSLNDRTVAAKARGILDRNAEALRLIHRATSMPRCDFRPDWSTGWSRGFPHWSKLYRCSRLLALESATLLHAGRVDGAVEACAANLRLAEAADDPLIMGQGIRYGILAIASKGLAIVLSDSQPSDRVCRSVAAQIAGLDPAASFVATVKAERAMGLWIFNLVRSTPDPVRALNEFLGSAPGKGHLPQRPLKNPPRHDPQVDQWLASDELLYLRLMERSVRQAPLPYRDAVRIHPSGDEERESLDPSHRCLITWNLMVVDSTRSAAMRDQVIAYLGLDQIALLLKAYRAGRGKYPVSLAELASYAGRALPEDPFSGKPFVYHRDGSGFVVYSWGLNLKDDRGVPQSFQGRKPEGDMVVRCVR